MREQQLKQALHELAANEVPVSLNLWPAIRPLLHPHRQFQSPFRQMSISRVVWAGIAMVLMFGIMLAVSPGALAQGGEAVRIIGQMVFRDRWPLLSTTPDPNVVVKPAWPRGTSLDEAKTLVPFAFNVPTWAPEGYVFNAQVSVLSVPQGCTKDCKWWQVRMLWQKPQPPGNPAANIFMRNQINFRVASPSAIQNITDLITLEELTINGRPTALMGVYGAAPAEPRNLNLTKALQWIQDDRSYMLIGGPGVRVEDLIQMVESIR